MHVNICKPSLCPVYIIVSKHVRLSCVYFYRSTFLAAIVLILVATLISEANSSCSQYDKDHNFACSAGQSVCRVYGHHDNRREDRVYCYSCRYAGTQDQCYQTGYVNSWDAPVATLCKPNYFVAGVTSYHDNGKEDRRFDYKCCRNRNRCTRNCYLTGPVNSFDGRMNYNVGSGQVIVGAFSWHSNKKE